MKPHQAGVNRREEVFAQEEHQAHRQNTEREKARREQFLMSEGGFQKLVITTAKLLETALERSLVTPEDRLWSSSLMLMTPHDVHHQRRDQGPREEIRSQHCEHHGFRQRHEQVSRDAGEKEHGHKYDANAKRGDERRHSNLRRAIEDRLFHLLALGKIALDILDLDGRVVHKDANCEGQTAEG